LFFDSRYGREDNENVFLSQKRMKKPPVFKVIQALFAVLLALWGSHVAARFGPEVGDAFDRWVALAFVLWGIVLAIYSNSGKKIAAKIKYAYRKNSNMAPAAVFVVFGCIGLLCWYGINKAFDIIPVPRVSNPNPTPSPTPTPIAKLDTGSAATVTPNPQVESHLSASEIAKEFAKLVPQQDSERTELMKLRANAISVIRGLNDLLSVWQKRDHDLQRRLIPPVSETERISVQSLRDINNQELSKNYFRDFHVRAVDVRDALLGHIAHVPTDRSGRANDSYYPTQGNNRIWSSALLEQTCDLIKLLNEIEIENNIQLSVVDIRQSLHCH